MRGAIFAVPLVAAALLYGSDAYSSTPEQAPSADDPQVALGRAAFERNCAACHGKGPSEGRVPLLPGTFALSLKYRGQLPAALEDRSDLSPEYIEVIVRNGIFSMPPLRKTEVSDEELRAIAAYFRVSSRNPGGPITTGPNAGMARTGD
jgi:mono/diheme cytochrome c family protein